MRLFKQLVVGLVLLLVIAACNNTAKEPEEKTVKVGSTVEFDYAAGFANSTLFDTSFETAAREAGIFNPERVYQPEKVVMGQDFLLPALANAMLGMKEGETKSITLGPEQAYGAKIENSTHVISSRALGNNSPEIGEIIVIATPEGDNIPVFVTEVNADNVTIDQNHPLAGEEIQFAILIKSIE